MKLKKINVGYGTETDYTVYEDVVNNCIVIPLGVVWNGTRNRTNKQEI